MHCENDPQLFDFQSNATRDLIFNLSKFQRVYAPVHGWICVVLCLFGVLTNLIHCAVLTRPQMRTSAVNCIMTGVALCDMGTMGSYFIYIIHFVIQRTPNSCSNTMTYWWMTFLLFHMFLSITLHTTTLWLAVVMAFMRRMTLRAAILNSQWQKARLAKRICFVVLTIVILLSIPTLMVHEIRVWPHDRWSPPANGYCDSLYPANYTEAVYTFAVTQGAMANGCMIFKTNLWLTGILFKVIPCLLLIILSSSLMWKLRSAEKKRQSLLMNGGNDSNKRINPDRTTTMLIAILIVFLLTEFPQGVLAILNAVYTSDVHKYIYFNLGDLLDLLSLMNSSVNFVLYCLMSSRYRHAFCSMVLPLYRCGYSLTFMQTTNQHFLGITGYGGTQNSELQSRTQNNVHDLSDLQMKRSMGYRVIQQEPSSMLIPISAKPSKALLNF